MSDTYSIDIIIIIVFIIVFILTLVPPSLSLSARRRHWPGTLEEVTALLFSI
jgi:hypothetical protein